MHISFMKITLIPPEFKLASEYSSSNYALYYFRVNTSVNS